MSENLKISEHLDWVEITYPRLDDRFVVEYPPGWSKKRIPARPLHGYNVAARYEDGRLEMSNFERKDMGVHVVMTASTLKNLSVDHEEMLKFFVSHGAHVTRLDVAVDRYDRDLNFDELWQQIKGGAYRCRLRKPPLRYNDTHHGDTIYFGRMKSSILTRIYNKAVEQKYDGVWVRVETMMRHRRAHNAAKMIARGGVKLKSLVAGHVKIENDWWDETMSAPAVKTRFVPDERGDARYRWLMKTVVSALAREIFLRGEEFKKEFDMRVLDELVRLESMEFKHG